MPLIEMTELDHQPAVAFQPRLKQAMIDLQALAPLNEPDLIARTVSFFFGKPQFNAEFRQGFHKLVDELIKKYEREPFTLDHLIIQVEAFLGNTPTHNEGRLAIRRILFSLLPAQLPTGLTSAHAPSQAIATLQSEKYRKRCTDLAPQIKIARQAPKKISPTAAL